MKKNIHILRTDRPSKLYGKDDKYKLDNSTIAIDWYISSAGYEPQYIYIISDEEIKEGDWCLDKFNQRWKLENNKLTAFDNKGIRRFSTDNVLGHECKKIILTTDPKLIADGVQSIDDEFLEWFVKNPTCELVEVDESKYFDGSHGEYLIIIPQEEPKQELLPDFKITKNIFDFVTDLSDTNKEEPKHETLEEIAENYAKQFNYAEDSSPQIDFIAGAEWQAKRMYSEEDLYDILFKHTEYFLGHGDRMSLTEWLEQFKKK